MSKEEEIRNVNIRRKNLLYLMQRYLLDNGYYQTAESLKTESRLTDDYELCDNVDLDAMYLEYASYYQLKFGKYPKMLRKVKPPVKIELAAAKKKPAKGSPKDATMPTQQTPAEPADGLAAAELQVTVTRIETKQNDGVEVNERLRLLQEIEHVTPGGCGAGDDLLNCSEWQTLADLVKTTILRDELKLRWTDMCGNLKAMETVKEAVLTPIKYPQLFANGLKPWKSVLLHGPPGSGKTLLAKVLYAETKHQVTFFNVTSSVVISKWRGESEKILKILFHLARKHAPSIIFLDEIEGLTSKRDRPSDHESSKRFKNELLQLLDGMEQHNAGVFVLASTNLPWDIDEAFLRRFEKKMLVQLPNAVERARLINKLLPCNVSVSKEKLEQLVRLSEHFTGDEIRLACKEIAMQTVRRVTVDHSVDTKIPTECMDKQLEQAFRQVKPLSVKLMPKHELWQQEHGS